MKLPFSRSFSYFLTVALLLTCSSSSSGLNQLAATRSSSVHLNFSSLA